MEDRHTLLDTVAGVFAPIHPDGHKFVIGSGLATLVLFWVWQPAGWIGLIVTGWCAYFFRDPERVTPVREGLVVAPGDGRIAAIERVLPPPELDLPAQTCTRISIFLSIFDVHINRTPAPGRIVRAVYVPGLFLNAELDKASEDNERRCLTIETASGARLGCVQIAGLVARRIVTFVTEGSTLSAGERIGLIRFGSRVDVYLPPDAEPLVAAGQYAIGGETVYADLKSEEGPREVRTS